MGGVNHELAAVSTRTRCFFTCCPCSPGADPQRAAAAELQLCSWDGRSLHGARRCLARRGRRGENTMRVCWHERRGCHSLHMYQMLSNPLWAQVNGLFIRPSLANASHPVSQRQEPQSNIGRGQPLVLKARHHLEGKTSCST